MSSRAVRGSSNRRTRCSRVPWPTQSNKLAQGVNTAAWWCTGTCAVVNANTELASAYLLHGIEDELFVAESGEEAAGVEPSAAREDGVPVEVTHAQHLRGFVGAVVEHDRRANAATLVAVHGGHVGAEQTRRASVRPQGRRGGFFAANGSANKGSCNLPIDAVVLKVLVERRDTHAAHEGVDAVAHGVVHHSGRDGGLWEAKRTERTASSQFVRHGRT